MKLAGKTDVGSVRPENQDDYRAGELNSDAAWGLVYTRPQAASLFSSPAR